MTSPRRLIRIAAAALALLAAAPAAASPVLMISIDGLRPADVIDAQKRGLKLPNLRAFVTKGAYATGVRNVLPTVTYPNHTTLITGVAPALHGITNNTTFDPLQKNMGGWYWYAADIRVPTLWDAVHAAGRPVASLSWPVSVGTTAIDFNIPEVWRARTADDAKLLAALSTPGLAAQLMRDTALTPEAFTAPDGGSDVAWMRLAAALIASRHPQFMTLHVSSLDHYQHEIGPGTPKARAVLETIDTGLGELIAAARQAEPDLVVAVVSDHGFAPVEHDVNLMTAFVGAGLAALDPVTGKVKSWEAASWGAGGSAAVMLARPDDPALKAKVEALLKTLAADPANGIAGVVDRSQIAALGGGTEPSYWIDFHPGYESGGALTGPLLGPRGNAGTHGYFPAHPEMRSTFMIEGPGLSKKGALGEVDMRDIAPTLAKILGVALPQATGKPLF